MKDLLTMSMEAFDDTPLAGMDDDAVEMAIANGDLAQETYPGNYVSQEQLDKIVNIADRMFSLSSESLSGNVLRITLENLTQESAWDTFKKGVMVAAKVIMEYLRKLMAWFSDFMWGISNTVRLRRGEAGKVLQGLITASRKHATFEIPVKGDGVAMLTTPATGLVNISSASVAKEWRDFNANFVKPFGIYMTECGMTLRTLDSLLTVIFRAKGINLVEADKFDKIEAITVPELKSNAWQTQSNAMSPNGGTFKSYAQLYGNPSTDTGSPFTIASGGSIIGINGENVRPLVVEETDDEVTIPVDTIVEYAKTAVAVLDVISNMITNHRLISETGKTLLNGYTYRFVDTKLIDVNDPTANQIDESEIARRNNIVNGAIGYISYLMNVSNVIVSHLLRYQSTIISLATEVTTRIESTATDKELGL